MLYLIKMTRIIRSAPTHVHRVVSAVLLTSQVCLRSGLLDCRKVFRHSGEFHLMVGVGIIHLCNTVKITQMLINKIVLFESNMCNKTTTNSMTMITI